ncbi:MAG: sensor histidine kinase [Clostridiales bacterium]|nr:sensor histidine kinase [Clostridiales bacterium]
MLEYIFGFFVRHGFVVELIICGFLFVLSFERRKYFILRLLGVVAVFFCYSSFWYFLETTAFPTGSLPMYLPMIRYTLCFLLLVLGIFICFNKSIITSLFCGIAAFSTQHGAYKLGELVQRSFTGIVSPAWCYAFYIIVEIVAYVLVFLAFSKKIKLAEKEYLENKQVIYLSIALIMYCIVFQYSTSMDMKYYLIYALYDITCSVFTLVIQFSILKNGKIQHEYKVMEHLRHLEKSQFDMSRKNMELLNIKYHDLKKLISSIGDMPFDERYELERAITVYDMTIKTGNEVLDVILTEKTLFCDQKGVRFEKIVDGKLLNFMSGFEVYSLFGNALDNAIEAVSKIQDAERKVISLMVRKNRGMVLIHIENCFDGDVVFENDLPVTTKGNKLYHGFGTKSIKRIVENYGGDFDMCAEDGVFKLNILLPEIEDKNNAKLIND